MPLVNCPKCNEQYSILEHDECPYCLRRRFERKVSANGWRDGIIDGTFLFFFFLSIVTAIAMAVDALI